MVQIQCKVLFDGEKVIPDAVVHIKSDRIDAIYTGIANLPVSSAVPEQTLKCHFLMPGLIDSHVHISGYVEGMPAGVPFEPMKNFMRLLIYNGITTVRDTGNSIETINYLRDWGAKYIYPRVFGSGPILDIPPLTWSFSRIVRDPEAAKRQVELLWLEGMDFIKTHQNVTPEVMKAIVDAATARGMRVAAHVLRTTAQQACQIGVTSLEHVSQLFDQTCFPSQDSNAFGSPRGRVRLWSHLDLQSDMVTRLQDLLVKQGTYVCPTLLTIHRWCSLEDMVNEPYLDYMVGVMPYHQYFKHMRSPLGMAIGKPFMKRYMPIPTPTKAERAEIEGGLENMRAMTKRLHEAGVNLVVGTDSPNPSIVPGFSLHQEMAMLVRCGIPPLAVLTNATATAAKLIDRPDLGKVNPNASADLVLLDGNPIDNISNSMKIQAVIKAGKLVDRERVLELAKGQKGGMDEASNRGD